ncbi:MAG: DUF4400 domain-containing protein [Curvibacter sp.]|jgi:Domain of unknown function (DUF4400)|nr:MAG: DUF4400 domain-containing protein [Curvibacter sp.]
MIRFVAIASLTTVLLIVLYLPSTHPPIYFMALLRQEHELNMRFWGDRHGLAIMERMLDMQTSYAGSSPLPQPSAAPTIAGANQAVANEMSKVGQRLFNSPYFRSIDTLFALALYRLATLWEGFKDLWIVWIALLVDSFLVRAIKAKEWRHHNPEMFALYASSSIITACGLVIALVLPMTIAPYVWVVSAFMLWLFASRAVVHFHKTG